MPAAPKYEDLDIVPKFDMPSRAPPVVDENLGPQEVRDARAAKIGSFQQHHRQRMQLTTTIPARVESGGGREGITR
jgi:hypothetical protein